MRKLVFLLLGLSFLSGCTVQIWGKREVIEIESTPLQETGSSKAASLPPAAIPVIEAFFKGFFGFLNKSREQKEETHRKGIEFNRPVRRESDFNLIKVTE